MTSPARLSDQDFELLTAYLDDQLASSARSELERRLAVEPGLRAALDELQQTVRILKATPRLAPPRNFTLDPVRFGRRVPWWARSGAMQLVGALGAAASVVLIVLGLVLTPLRNASPAPVAFFATSQTAPSSGLAISNTASAVENQVAAPTNTVLKAAGSTPTQKQTLQQVLQGTAQAALEATLPPTPVTNNRASDSAAQSSLAGTATQNFGARATSAPTATLENSVASLNTATPQRIAPPAVAPQSAAAGPAPSVNSQNSSQNNSQPASGAPQNGSVAGASGGSAAQLTAAAPAQTDELAAGQGTTGQFEETPSAAQPAPNVQQAQQQAQQPQQPHPSQEPQSGVLPTVDGTVATNRQTVGSIPTAPQPPQLTPTFQPSARGVVTLLPPTQTALPTGTPSSAPSEKPTSVAVATVPTTLDNAAAARDFVAQSSAPPLPMLLIIGIAMLVFSVMLFALGWLRSRLSP